jgi:hypothetical protein
LDKQAEQADGSSTRIHNGGVVRTRDNSRPNHHDIADSSVILVLGSVHQQNDPISQSPG